MDHGDHGGHGGMDHDMPGMPTHPSMPCKMSMVWNGDPIGVCLVFPTFQITSHASLVFWLAMITLLSVFCEYLRLSLSSFDRALRSNLRGGALAPSSAPASGAGRSSTPVGLRRPSGFAAQGEGSEEALLGRGGASRYWGVVRLPWVIQLRRSLGYAAHVALTFYIMLLVMSYNMQIIGAIILGAFIGHFVFQRNIDLSADDGETGKGLQCH
ncbi:hypothetical protein JCM8097_003022 [Rhodosporidiobolus ruineniae]